MKDYKPNKVKFVFCIFTYGEDAYTVAQTIRALRRLGANRSNIFVFDDANNPLPYPIPNTQYTQTTFNRNGNLNGTSCADGELLCMYEAAQKTKAHVVVKVDSDVIINSLDWITNNDFMNSHCGFHIGVANHISGCCYSLPSWAILPMIKELKKYPQNSKGESLIISHLSRIIGLEHVAYDCNTTNPDLWAASSINGANLSDDGVIEPHTLLVMKNLQVILCDLIADTRDKHRNYLLMKKFLDFVEA